MPRGSQDPTTELSKTLKAILLFHLGDMTVREQVELLDKAGFGQTEIAEMIGSTSKSVSVRLAEIRRRNKRHTKMRQTHG